MSTSLEGARSTLQRDRRVAVVAFVALGALSFAHWSLADLSRDQTPQQHQWAYVVFFSALVLGVGVGMLVVAHQTPIAGARRTAWWVFWVTCAAGVTNLVEDGLGVGPAFFAFVVELVLLMLGCITLAILLALREEGRGRIWALAPVATMAAIVMYVELGGPLLLVTWLACAFACAVSRRRA